MNVYVCDVGSFFVEAETQEEAWKIAQREVLNHEIDVCSVEFWEEMMGEPDSEPYREDS